MDARLLGELKSEARLQEFLLGIFDGNIAVAYVVDCGWKVRVVPKYDAKVNININDNDERTIFIAFSPFEDEIEIRDFILPLVETETYRERTRDFPCRDREHMPGSCWTFDAVEEDCRKRLAYLLSQPPYMAWFPG